MSWTALEEERTGVTARVARQLPVVYLGRRLQCHRRVISECRGYYLVRLVAQPQLAYTDYVPERTYLQFSALDGDQTRHHRVSEMNIVRLAFLRHPNLVESIIWR